MISKSIGAIFIFSILLSGVSCTKAPIKKKDPRNKRYDSRVEDEFSRIENDQRDVLEYYRRLRSQDWENYKRKYHTNSPTRVKKSKPKTYIPQRYSTKKPTPKVARPPKPKPTRTSLGNGQIEEMKIEVRQHMDYFCMQMRKSARFSDTADCLAFTENIYSTCMASYPIIYDRSLVKCIRGKLH